MEKRRERAGVSVTDGQVRAVAVDSCQLDTCCGRGSIPRAERQQKEDAKKLHVALGKLMLREVGGQTGGKENPQSGW